MKKMMIAVTNDAKKATVVTHPAPHHGGDMMAVAIAAIVESGATVLRTRNLEAINEANAHGALICDVGGVYDPRRGFFDHHQREFAEMRADGTKYSSAGLLWKEYGSEVCFVMVECTWEQAEAAAAKVDEILIKGIDAIENGQIAPGAGGVMSVSQAIALLNSSGDKDTPPDEAFINAYQLAYTVLTRTIWSCVAVAKGRDAVEA